MPTIKEFTLQNSEGNLETRNVGADAQYIDLSYDASGEIIEDITIPGIQVDHTGSAASAIKKVSQPMAGATAQADGASGCIPAPLAGDNKKALKGNGTWEYSGHSILDNEGTEFSQREKLQLNNATIVDSADHNTTIVTPNDATFDQKGILQLGDGFIKEKNEIYTVYNGISIPSEIYNYSVDIAWEEIPYIGVILGTLENPAEYGIKQIDVTYCYEWGGEEHIQNVYLSDGTSPASVICPVAPVIEPNTVVTKITVETDAASDPSVTSSMHIGTYYKESQTATYSGRIAVRELIGSSANRDGRSGLVPEPKAGDNDKFLSGNGTWRIPTEVQMQDNAGIITFGIDDNGNYGYIKAGADTVTPFKTGDVEGTAVATDVLSGKTFSSVAAGTNIEGTMVDYSNNVQYIRPALGNTSPYQYIDLPPGYHIGVDLYADGLRDVGFMSALTKEDELEDDSPYWYYYNLTLYQNKNKQSGGADSIRKQIIVWNSSKFIMFDFKWAEDDNDDDYFVYFYRIGPGNERYSAQNIYSHTYDDLTVYPNRIITSDKNYNIFEPPASEVD